MPKTSREILDGQKNPGSLYQQQHRQIKKEFDLPDCAHNNGRRPAAMVSGRGQELDQYITRNAATSQNQPSIRPAEVTQSTATNNAEIVGGTGCADKLFPAIAIPVLWYMCAKSPQIQLIAQKIFEQLSNQ